MKKTLKYIVLGLVPMTILILSFCNKEEVAEKKEIEATPLGKNGRSYRIAPGGNLQFQEQRFGQSAKFYFYSQTGFYTYTEANAWLTERLKAKPEGCVKMSSAIQEDIDPNPKPPKGSKRYVASYTLQCRDNASFGETGGAVLPLVPPKKK